MNVQRIDIDVVGEPMGEADERTGKEGDDFLQRLRASGPDDVLIVGTLPIEAISSWNDLVTDIVVITGERRSHFLQRHPEIAADESLLIGAICDPDEIHANAVDPRIAIFYKQMDGDYVLRVPVWLSDRDDRQNSVLSLRRARRKELEKGRSRGGEGGTGKHLAGLPLPA